MLGNDRWSPYGALWSQPVGTMTSQGLIHRAGTTTWRLASSSATLLTVARGDTQRDFAAAAAEHGIVLERQSLPWLCERGHLALPNVAAEARALLERIYIALGADLDLLGTARSNISLVVWRVERRADVAGVRDGEPSRRTCSS